MSSLDALHEDIYFAGADYFKNYGLEACGAMFEEPGLILPVIRQEIGKPQFEATIFDHVKKEPQILADDHVLPHPKVHSLPGVIMEFKAIKDDAGLSASAAEALKQIEDKHYDTDMEDHGIKEIVKYGIAFAGKNVEIAKG